MELKITAEVKGIAETIEEQSKAIKKQIPKALQYVGAEMKVNLQKHIYEDWYLQYTPSVYKRRTDNPNLGIPIGSDKNISINVNEKQIEFDFSPDLYNKEFSPLNYSSDRMITWIQQTHEIFGVLIPPRPFWNNFLNEENNGATIAAFIKGMKPLDVTEDESDKDLEICGYKMSADEPYF